MVNAFLEPMLRYPRLHTARPAKRLSFDWTSGREFISALLVQPLTYRVQHAGQAHESS
jgi:hypothetical protein